MIIGDLSYPIRLVLFGLVKLFAAGIQYWFSNWLVCQGCLVQLDLYLEGLGLDIPTVKLTTFTAFRSPLKSALLLHFMSE